MLNSNCLLIISLLLIVFLKPSHATPDYGWKLQRSTNTIKLYSRKVAGSKFIQTKAEVKITTPVSDLLAMFGDGSKCLKWQERCYSSRITQQISELELYAYSVIDLPWPVSNGDFVFHSLVTVDPLTKTIKLTFSPAKNMYPQTKYIRATANISYSLRELTSSSSVLTITMHTEFGGSISPRIINSILIDELQDDIDNLISLLKDK